MALVYSNNGPAVKSLQTRLNAAGRTRLPRLKEDADYGSLTMAGVMEFQFFSGFPTPQQDGKFGPLTDRKLAAHRTSSPPP